MPLPPNEPTTLQAVNAWIEKQTRSSDKFRHIAEASDEHRSQHGCDVYPSPDGPLLGALAASTGARRILEVGCGLGYSALSLAHGAGDNVSVETLEHDSEHADLARRHIEAEQMGARVRVLVGWGRIILPDLRGPYDLIFFDGDPAESVLDLGHFERLLRAGGLLISANLFLAQYARDLPGLDKTAAYREQIMRSERWFTAYLPNGKALSIRR
ncbi:O-methyltransferase [Candidatus Binatus sp.]|jgi:predicted O-methyltransferase YrrM|uniref:O-methyltransferase n=1 Tax=Candidatus Binatus sp. TaxID=2811406 RepID=UPI003BE42BB3